MKKQKKVRIDPNFVPKPAIKIKQGFSLEDNPRNNDARKKRFSKNLKS